MLAVGLVLQIGGLLLLSGLNPGWGATFSVAWVVMAQGISGVAKDITKTASKSAIKATSEGGAGQLFRWVAWFTGSKNAMKGFGFFVGGLLLQAVGFRGALWLMAAMLGVLLANVLLSLPVELGKAKASKTFGELFAKSRAINLLAAARTAPTLGARPRRTGPLAASLSELFGDPGLDAAAADHLPRGPCRGAWRPGPPLADVGLALVEEAARTRPRRRPMPGPLSPASIPRSRRWTPCPAACRPPGRWPPRPGCRADLICGLARG